MILVYLGYISTRYLKCTGTWNTKRPSKNHLKYKNWSRHFNSYIFYRWLPQSPVANSHFTTRKTTLSLVISTVFLLSNALYPPLHRTPVDIRDMCTIPRSILAFFPFSRRCGSAGFHLFNNLGISSSINPDNVFGVVSSPSPYSSSGHNLIPCITVLTMYVFLLGWDLLILFQDKLIKLLHLLAIFSLGTAMIHFLFWFFHPLLLFLPPIASPHFCAPLLASVTSCWCVSNVIYVHWFSSTH